MTSVSARAAEWAVGTSLPQVPEAVVTNTKLRILDLVGVMLAARSHETVAAARQASSETDGEGEVAVVGHAERRSLAGAAFVNGVMSAVLEFDDTHLKSNIHPTGPAVSAVVPECHRRGLSGRALIEAVLIGSELCCRLGLVAPVRMHELGFHPTAVFGVFGAVYALAKARGLAPAQIVDAIGCAGSLSAGLISSFEDGTSTKTLHVGLVAGAAVRAVALAAHGVSGPGTVFEGRFGWFRSHVQGPVEFRFDAVTARLGDEWEVLNIASKLHPCAYTMMPHIRAAIALRNEHRIAPADIVAIDAYIMPRSFPTVCEPVADKLRPRTSWHGRISLQHTVAEALARGRMDKDAYAPESLRDPVINALADKVTCLPDHAAGADTTRSSARVTVRLRDGRELSHTVEDMPGTRSNPIGAADYAAKFRANADGVLAPQLIEDTIERLLALETVENVASVFDPLSVA